MVFQTTQVS